MKTPSPSSSLRKIRGKHIPNQRQPHDNQTLHPSLHHLTLKALEKLDLDRHYADPDLPIEDELDLALVKTATKNDDHQTLTLVFIDGVQEEFTYREILGKDYPAYAWTTSNLPLPL